MRGSSVKYSIKGDGRKTMVKNLRWSCEYLLFNNVTTEIKVYSDLSIEVTNFTDDIVDTAFGVKTKVDINDLDEFFRDRCFPETRGDCKELLEFLGLPVFDALSICRITHGMFFDDHYWVRFDSDGDLTYDEARKSVCLKP